MDLLQRKMLNPYSLMPRVHVENLALAVTLSTDLSFYTAVALI